MICHQTALLFDTIHLRAFLRCCPGCPQSGSPDFGGPDPHPWRLAFNLWPFLAALDAILRATVSSGGPFRGTTASTGECRIGRMSTMLASTRRSSTAIPKCSGSENRHNGDSSGHALHSHQIGLFEPPEASTSGMPRDAEHPKINVRQTNRCALREPRSEP
jgi:hypothetical protein